MTHRVVLAGCTPVPLAAYLKALGVLRLVAEQADPDARGYWENEQFVLESRLDGKELERFFLEDYEPTPVIAPWNGGSGFYPKDNKSGLEPIESGRAGRFGPLREAIGIARTELDRLGFEARPEGEEKRELLNRLRGSLDERALAWLDAAVLITEDNPRYPPLLGTGGNDGRLDFTNNFMQRLVALLDPATGQPLESSESLLRESLLDAVVSGLGADVVGQFSPGSAGGVNQTSGFESKPLVNPWDFVFMLEGAVLFAASATRRLGSSMPGALSYPFTVHVTAGGSGAMAIGDEDNARAEMWMPLWSAPSGLRELDFMLSEGRVTLGRAPVRDGLEFARAVARLGVDRGIEAFQRYAFLMRSGKAYFATPLNRIDVVRNPPADLLDELDHGGWLSRFRRFARKEGSRRVLSLLRKLESAIFRLALAHKETAESTRRLLIVLGEITRYFARSPVAREACGPVPRLSPRWVTQAEPGGGPEFALAVALAGLHARHAGKQVYPMRMHLAPMKDQAMSAWDEHAVHRVTWGQGSVETNLAAALKRRLLDADRSDLDDRPLAFRRTASLPQVAAWLADELDTARLDALLPGLMLVDIPAGRVGVDLSPRPLPAAYRLLKPFFTTDYQLHRAGLLPSDRRLSIPPDMPRRLLAGQVGHVLPGAIRNLRVAGIPVDVTSPAPGTRDGRRLLAALMVPISDHDLLSLFPRERAQEDRQAG